MTSARLKDKRGRLSTDGGCAETEQNNEEKVLSVYLIDSTTKKLVRHIGDLHKVSQHSDEAR